MNEFDHISNYRFDDYSDDEYEFYRDLELEGRYIDRYGFIR